MQIKNVDMNKINIIIVFATVFLFSYIYLSYANAITETTIDKQIKYLEDQNNTAFERLQQQVYDCYSLPLLEIISNQYNVSNQYNATINNICKDITKDINLQHFELKPFDDTVANNATYLKNLIAKQLFQAMK